MLSSAGGVVVDYAKLSDPGRDPDKQLNEDAVAVTELPFGIAAIVCDGMGGHEAGEVASRIAVERILETLRSGSRPFERLVSNAIERAHADVYALGNDRPLDSRPGSTAVLIVFAGQEALVGHVGDSRAYRIRARTAERLTRDHSVVEALLAAGAIDEDAAKIHPDANRITRALGIATEIEPEVRAPLRVEPGDAFVLCSDGLTDLVADPEIANITASAASPESACEGLVALANDRGGHDNISVAVLRVLTALPDRSEHTLRMSNPEAHTVVDGPAFTVMMHPADAPKATVALDRDPKATVALDRDPTRSTAPTLVDPIVAASLDAKSRLARAEPPPGNTRPSIPHRMSTHEGRWLFFAAAGLCVVILGAIVIWSAFR